MKRTFRNIFEGSGAGAARAEEARRHFAELARRLETVERGSHEEALLYNRAADLALTAGDRERALQYYGRSIDAYMALRQFNQSTAVCRKLLRLVPDVVRARCTLSWLCLGKGHLDQAREHLELYVTAARRAKREGMAAQQLRLMAQYARDSGLRDYIAAQLRELGDSAGAGALEAWSETVPSPEQIGWDPIVFAALLTPDELRQAHELGLALEPPQTADNDELPLYWPGEE
jgi:hypothetical protein